MISLMGLGGAQRTSQVRSAEEMYQKKKLSRRQLLF